MKIIFFKIKQYKYHIIAVVFIFLILSQTAYESFSIEMKNQKAIEKYWIIAGNAQTFYQENALHLITKKGSTDLFMIDLPPFVGSFRWRNFPYLIFNLLPSENDREISFYWSPNYNEKKMVKIKIPAFEDQVIFDIEQFAPSWIKSEKSIGFLSFQIPEDISIALAKLSFQSKLTWMDRLSQIF